MLPPVSIAVVTSVFIVACWVSDVRTRTIPNVLTGPILLLGVGLNWFLFGSVAAATSFGGAALCVALLLAPFALGGIGGGDVKMMAAIGALLGPRIALVSLALGLLLGGIIMIIHLARMGRLQEKLGVIRIMVSRSLVERSTEALKISDSAPETVALPYSVPLGIGTFLVLGGSWGSVLLSGGIQ